METWKNGKRTGGATVTGAGAVIMAVALSGCGGGGGDGSATGVKVESRNVTYTSSPTGVSAKPSVSFYGDGASALGIRVTGADADGDGTVSKATLSNVRLEDGDTLAKAGETPLSCSSVETGSAGTGDIFDVGVSLDTTASMGAAAGVLAQKTAAFAKALESEGLNVRFAGVTVGDAFATKETADLTQYTDSVSQGPEGTPPMLDGSERPGTGTDLIDATAMETFFTEVYNVVGTGSGGWTNPENYLGAVEYLNNNVKWRDSAGRILISIGDDCSHTPTSVAASGYDWTGFTPPDPAAFTDALVDAGVGVNVVGADGLTCGTDYYDMAELGAATGGGFTPIGSCGSQSTCKVDLSTLPLVAAITTARATESCDITGVTGEKTVRMDITIEGFTWSVAAVLSIS